MHVNFHVAGAHDLAVLPRMLERDAGTIVNVSSMGGRIGIAHEAAYCAAKYALCGWSEVMASTSTAPGSRSSSCCPARSTPRSGTSPATTPPFYDGPFVPAADCAADIVDAHRGRRLRVLRAAGVPGRDGPPARDGRRQDHQRRRLRRHDGQADGSTRDESGRGPMAGEPRAGMPIASTSASCCPGATSPRDDQIARQMVNFVYLDRRPRDRRGGGRRPGLRHRRARSSCSPPTACASPACSPPTTTPTTSAGT